MKTLFEQNGGTYSDVGEYRMPNLSAPEESESHLGMWGHRRLNYLKKYQRVLYVNLLTSGELSEHLREIDETAYERLETIIGQMAVMQGVIEQLKAENQMIWVSKMNNIRACADEIIRNEIIYQQKTQQIARAW